MTGILNILLSAAKGLLPAPVALFNYVVSLLPGNGTNGGNNNTFLDTSAVSATLTRNGEPTQGSFTPFSQPAGYWSNYFDAQGATKPSISAPAGASISGTTNFTAEWYIYPINFASGYQVILANDTSSGFAVTINSTGTLGYGRALVATDGTTTGTVTFNTWNHVAFVRSGTGANQFVCYINGVVAGTFTNATSYASGVVRIGTDGGGSAFPLTAWVSNLRLNNTALYSSPFTPSTTPLTNVAGTLLLTCSSYSFADRGTANTGATPFPITPNGTPQIRVFAPFTSGVPYSAATVGASLYFDGNGDYITNTANQFQYIRGTGNWTWEGFVYPLAYGSSSAGGDVFAVTNIGTTGGRNNGFHINLGQDINSFRLISNASGTWADNLSVGTGNGPPLYAWTHMAVVREGDRISIFKNGNRVNTGTGFSTYQFSPSAANSAGNYALAVQGGGSLNAPGASANFGTGNFTAEFFVYRPNVDFASGFMLSTGTNTNSFELRVGDNNCLIFHTAGGNVFTQPTVPQNQWVHCACVRSGTHLAAWINGTRVYSNTNYTKNFSGDGNTYVIGGRGGGDGLIYEANMRLSSNVYYAPTSTSITPPYTGFGFSAGDRIIAGVSNVLLNNTGGTALTVRTGSPYVWPWGPATNASYSQAANSVIGRFSDATITRDYSGYIFNPRFTQTAVYSASATSITVPTAPLSTDANTLEMIYGTNGQVIDATAENDWVTLGNAQISTAQSKWGGSSIYLPGTLGSYLSSVTTPNFSFGTGDFTAEGWIYFNGVSTAQGIFGGSDTGTWEIRWVNSDNTLRIGRLNVAFDTSFPWTPVTARWYHVAVARKSGTIRAFIDGSQIGSATNTNSYNCVGNFFVGTTDATNNPFNGYIDDARVTAYAIYTSSFLVPDAPFATS